MNIPTSLSFPNRDGVSRIVILMVLINRALGFSKPISHPHYYIHTPVYVRDANKNAI